MGSNTVIENQAISPEIASLILEALETILAKGGFGEIILVVKRGEVLRVNCLTSKQPKHGKEGD